MNVRIFVLLERSEKTSKIRTSSRSTMRIEQTGLRRPQKIQKTIAQGRKILKVWKIVKDQKLLTENLSLTQKELKSLRLL